MRGKGSGDIGRDRRDRKGERWRIVNSKTTTVSIVILISPSAVHYQAHAPVKSRRIHDPAIQTDRSEGSPSGTSDQDDLGVHTQGLCG